MPNKARWSTGISLNSKVMAALLGLVTLALKSLLEWRYADQLAASHRR